MSRGFRRPEKRNPKRFLPAFEIRKWTLCGAVAYTGTVTFTGSKRVTYGRPTSRGKRLQPQSPCTLVFQPVVRSEFVNSREIVEHAGVGVEECKLLIGDQVADDECALSYSPEPFSTLQIGKLGTFGYGQAEL